MATSGRRADVPENDIVGEVPDRGVAVRRGTWARIRRVHDRARGLARARSLAPVRRQGGVETRVGSIARARSLTRARGLVPPHHRPRSRAPSLAPLHVGVDPIAPTVSKSGYAGGARHRSVDRVAEGWQPVSGASMDAWRSTSVPPAQRRCGLNAERWFRALLRSRASGRGRLARWKGRGMR